MAALSVQVPYPVFYDRAGTPLDNGNIYIGVANLDPVTNPLQVYYDEALTLTASQPLITSNGYVYRNGTPAQLYVNAVNFSILVNDSKNLLVYSFPDGTGLGAGAASIEYDPPFTGAVTSGYTVADKLAQSVSVNDFYDATTTHPWADAFEAAANSFGANVSGQVIVPPGQYQMERTVTTPGFIHWIGDGAELYANVDDQIFFTGFPVYFTCFQGFSFFGNGYARTRAFSLQSWRVASSIVNCTGTDLEYFAYLGEGCFGSLIANCATLRVPFPVRIGQNNSAFHILSCQFDNGATVAGTGVGIGVEIATGGIVSVGVKITSGYIQGFDHGVIDGAVGTTIDTVYFETNVVADILGSAALFGAYNSCNHPAPVPGCVAYELVNCENVTIYNPIVPSTGRDFVFDVDATNNNCTIYMPGNDISWNFPTGDLQYLGRIQAEQRGTATPTAIGSTTAGTATYSTQSLSWRKTAYGAHVEISIAWTGHTGTGALIVEGIPNDMQPSGSAPLRFGQVVASGFAIAAGQIYAYFNGTGSQLSFGHVDTTGVISLITVPVNGTLNIVLDYDR